ncbi:MAG: hypothetical protein Q4G08_11820, partial [Capnocytophaga sp.]|nr:hypothetical protein [Capnocytophaga sp.]
ILLDDLEKEYTIKKYTLNTQKLYGIDKDVEMYNIANHNSNFRGYVILITALPDIDQNTTWKKIDSVIVNQNLIPAEVFKKEFHSKKKIFNQYKLIKKINTQYYASENCLVEGISFVKYPPVFNLSGEGTANLSGNIVSYQEVRKAYQDTYSDKFPMENKGVFLHHTIKNIYLSAIETINNMKVYRFWTFDDWHDEYGYNYHRGIDRFAYVEGKGIVGGSYDFYFDFEPAGFKRVAKTEIMWAKELFPEKQ